MLIAFATSAGLGRSQPMPNRPEAYRSDIPYGADPKQRLDVCRLPADPGSRPALVLLHGGGGDKAEFLGSACRLAALRGVVGVPVDYRHRLSVHWSSQLEDVQSAVAWLRAHASEFDVDPARICVLGASWGGYLAMLLAVQSDPSTARIACAIDEFGPVDFTNVPMPPGTADPGAFRRRLERASPLYRVSAQTAPTLIIQGTLDPYIKPEQSERLYQALRRAGVETRLITYRGGHGFKELTDEQRTGLWQTIFDFVVAAPPRG